MHVHVPPCMHSHSLLEFNIRRIMLHVHILSLICYCVMKYIIYYCASLLLCFVNVWLLIYWLINCASLLFPSPSTCMCMYVHVNDMFSPAQADVQAVTDGCNAVKYNITADVIRSIFRTYPAG